jgi:hypothetical protein
MLDWDNQKRVAADLTAAWQFIMKEGPTCQYPWGCVHTKTAILMAGKCQRRCPGAAGTKRQAKGDGPPKVDKPNFTAKQHFRTRPWYDPVRIVGEYLGVADDQPSSAARRFYNGIPFLHYVTDPVERRLRHGNDPNQHIKVVDASTLPGDAFDYEPPHYGDVFDKTGIEGDGPKGRAKPRQGGKKAPKVKVTVTTKKKNPKREVVVVKQQMKKQPRKKPQPRRLLQAQTQPDSLMPATRIPGARRQMTATRSMSHVIGSEYIAQITATVGYNSVIDANGVTVRYLDINPYAIGTFGKLVKQLDSRLKRYCGMYEKFRMTVRFTYVRSANFETTGDLCWFFDADASDSENWCFGDQRILTVAKNHAKCLIFPAATTRNQSITLSTPWLWTRVKRNAQASTDIRNVSFGRFYFINAEAGPINNGNGLGKLEATYSVQFSAPTLGEDEFHSSRFFESADQTDTTSLIMSSATAAIDTAGGALSSPNFGYETKNAPMLKVFHKTSDHLTTSNLYSTGGMTICTDHLVPAHQFIRLNTHITCAFSAAITAPALFVSLYDKQGNDLITTLATTSEIGTMHQSIALASDSKSLTVTCYTDIHVEPFAGPYVLDFALTWTTGVDTSSGGFSIDTLPSLYYPSAWTTPEAEEKELDLVDVKSEDLTKQSEATLSMKRGIVASYLQKLTRAERVVSKRSVGSSVL